MENQGSGAVAEAARSFGDNFARLKAEIARVIVGHDEVTRQLMFALFCGGHVLLEGVPGIGKTLLVRTLASALDLTFSRIQFTPDLLPADITGTDVLVPGGSDSGRTLQFRRGPVFANVVLADEINRATPKTQSALLEAMQERSVTVGENTHFLPQPFVVVATQNPIEMAGTYPLPEAQIDRFMFMLRVLLPDEAGLVEILDRTTGAAEVETKAVLSSEDVGGMTDAVRQVEAAEAVTKFAARITQLTHADNEQAPESVKKYVRYGASPRAAQSMLLGAKAAALASGRFNVSRDDIAELALPALRHRIILNFEAEAEGISSDSIAADVVKAASA